MNKKVYSLLCVTVACSLFFSAFAQNDSSWLDLGVLKLKRAFTQSICIKGGNPEKIAFASHSEANVQILYNFIPDT